MSGFCFAFEVVRSSGDDWFLSFVFVVVCLRLFISLSVCLFYHVLC